MASSLTSSIIAVVVIVMASLARDVFSIPQDDWYNDVDVDTRDDSNYESDDFHQLDMRQAPNSTTGNNTGGNNTSSVAPPSPTPSVNGSSTPASNVSTTASSNNTDTTTTTTTTTTPIPTTANGTAPVDNVIHTGSIFGDPNNPVIPAQYLLPVDGDAEIIQPVPGTPFPPSIIIPVAYQVPPGPSPPYSSYFVPQVQQAVPPVYPLPPFPPPILPPPPLPYFNPYARQDLGYPPPYVPSPIGVPMEGYPPPIYPPLYKR